MPIQIKLQVLGPDLTPRVLDSFAEDLGTDLPLEYRQFILSCNGGHALEYVVFDIGEGTRCIEYFMPWGPNGLNLSSDEPSLSIASCNVDGQEIWGTDFLAFAGVSGTSYLVLAIKGECKGQVWLFDYLKLTLDDLNSPPSRAWGDKGLLFIARSFEEFMEMIRHG